MTLPTPNDRILGHYRYVNHERVSAYEALGWINKGRMSGHHGYWSCLMYHPAKDEPPEPKPEDINGSEMARMARNASLTGSHHTP